MRHKGLFITGTDTDVGKTFIGAALCQHLFLQGISISPKKPAESGCTADDDGNLYPADAAQYFQAVDQTIPLDHICPHRYRAALAPTQAAALEGKQLTLTMLLNSCQESSNNTHFKLVEGAGGFYSPIADNALNADLAEALELPVLLIAADRLGCMNHILLSLEALERRKLSCAAIILNAVTQKPHDAPDNKTGLSGFTDIPIFCMPYQADSSTQYSIFSQLQQHL